MGAMRPRWNGLLGRTHHRPSADLGVEDLLAPFQGRLSHLALPALLFLVGHRPLAFLLGQGLLVAQPLVAWALSSRERAAWERWARLLSAPQDLVQLEQALERMARHRTTRQNAP